MLCFFLGSLWPWWFRTSSCGPLGMTQLQRRCCRGPPEKERDESDEFRWIYIAESLQCFPLPVYATSFRYRRSKSGFSLRFRRCYSLPSQKKITLFILVAFVLIKRGAKKHDIFRTSRMEGAEPLED